jgi:hypothetical protein
VRFASSFFHCLCFFSQEKWIMLRFVTCLVVVLSVLAMAMPASASVTNVAQWRGGENDNNPGPQSYMTQVDGTAVDGTGNGYNLTRTDYGPVTGGPFYEHAVDHPGVGMPPVAGGSTVDYGFAPGESGAYSSTTAVPIGTQNWGIQAWVKPNDGVNAASYLSNGGLGSYADVSLFQFDAAVLGQGTGIQYYAQIAGNAYPSGVLVDPTRWHSVALVNEAGTNKFYVDNQLVTSFVADAPATLGAFCDLGVNAAGGDFMMSGSIDEARVFTFAPGQFQVSDLGVTPEPGTLVLLTTGLIGLLAYAWRKRK